MKRSWIGVMLAVSSLCGLFGAFGHPAAGIVVTARGEVFFIHTGQGVCKIDADGKLTYIHKVKGGGHFLALDWSGKFSNQLPRLFEKLVIGPTKQTLLYASGGAPFVVSRDGNLYYGSGYPDGDDMTPGFHTLTRLSPDGKKVTDSATKTERKTKWDGGKLVSEISGFAVGKITETYSVDPEHHHLRIVAHIENARQPTTTTHVYEADGSNQ